MQRPCHGAVRRKAGPLGTSTMGSPPRGGALLRRLRLIAAVSIGLSLSGVHAASAGDTLIFSNETSDGSGNPTSLGGYAVGLYPNSDYLFAIGWAFTVPSSSDYRFDSGTFVASLDPNPPLVGGDVQLQLYDDNAGAPGSVVDTMIVPASALSDNLAFVGFDSTTHPILAAGQPYWLIASMPDPTTTSLWWVPGVPSPGTEAVSFDGGPFSLSTGLNQGAFAILGTAVPEPSPCAMLAMGLALAGIRLRAARHRHSEE